MRPCKRTQETNEREERFMEAEVKRRKRRVVLVALAACLVVAGIGGTLAWFSAKQSDEHVQGGQHHRSDDEAG